MAPLRYKREYKAIPVHSKTVMHVVCTTEPDEADEMIRKMHMLLGGRVEEERIIWVDVEYTPKEGPDQKPAVLQLCVDNEVLVYHISSVVNGRPQRLESFLNTSHFNYARFAIENDKMMLQRVGIQIRDEKYIDIQRKWRVPIQYNTRKRYESLADVAASVIDPFYKDIKKKIDREEDHKRWCTTPLPEELITYAVIDAYATFETWSHINNISMGLEKIRYERELKEDGIDLDEHY